MYLPRRRAAILVVVPLLGAGIIFPTLVAALGEGRPTLPPAKQAFEERYEERRAQAPRGSKDPETIRRLQEELERDRPPASPKPWPTGIFQENEAPFPSSTVRIANRSQQVLDGKHFVVYAGSLAQDPEQGILIVQVFSTDDLAVLDSAQRATPHRAGPLRIVAANGGRLTVKPERGEHVEFDVRSRRFAPNDGAGVGPRSRNAR